MTTELRQWRAAHGAARLVATYPERRARLDDRHAAALARLAEIMAGRTSATVPGYRLTLAPDGLRAVAIPGDLPDGWRQLTIEETD